MADKQLRRAIAVIGPPGSGKTVLTAVLTRNWRAPDATGAWLEPTTPATMKFMEKVQNTLTQGEWPQSTSKGELENYQWTLHLGEQDAFSFQLADLAGQDLMEIFHDGKLHSTEGPLREITYYLSQAGIVLCLLNLEDYFQSREKATHAEAALKAALDYFCRDPARRVCVVIPKIDLFVEEKKKYGGWDKLLMDKIGYVYQAYIHTKRITVYSVAAVANTRAVVTEQGIRRCLPPNTPLKSTDLDRLQTWIKASAQKLTVALETEEERATAQLHREQVPSSVPLAAPESSTTQLQFLWTLVVGFLSDFFLPLGVVFFFVWGLPWLIELWQPPTPPPAPPPLGPTIVENTWQDLQGGFGTLYNDDIEATAIVENQGPAAKVVVEATVYENGTAIQADQKWQWMQQGDRTRFVFTLDKIDDCDNPHEVKFRAFVPRSD